MRSLGWPLIQYDWCPYKKQICLMKPDAQEGQHVTSEAEAGWMLVQTKEHPGLRPHRRPGRALLGAQREPGPAGTSNFNSGLQNCENKLLF